MFNQQQQPKQPQQQQQNQFLIDQNNLESFSKNLYGNLISAIKISNTLPTEEDYSYYSTYPAFRDRMSQFGRRLLDLTDNFVQSENPKRPSIFDGYQTGDVEEISDRFSNIVEVVDGLIDRVDNLTDNMDKPNQSLLQTNTILASTTVERGGKSNEVNMFYGHNITRPQLRFEDVIDNTNFPFIPKITEKPNSLQPIDPIFKKSIIKSKEQEKIIYPHPYEFELNNFQYTQRQTQGCREMIYRSLEETPLTWVDNKEALTVLADKLMHVEEFAIDLEAHNYRSYQGFVCLMQISTRTEDYLIDTLSLRGFMHKLNSSFTNPRIVKVLHGSESDIKWLQRDFGLYIVNMFDTGQASRILEYPSASLAFLLRFYCAVEANKKFQLADWRIRPVPSEMAKYAREDTHYLLYIYDRLRNELMQRGNKSGNGNAHLLEVLRRSREICQLKYEKEVIDEMSHVEFCKKANLSYGGVNMRVFRILFHWREKVAREEDESVRYVLPNSMMTTIVEKQPTSIGDLLACCIPTPPLLKQHAHQLLQDILKARIEENNTIHQHLEQSSSGSGSNNILLNIQPNTSQLPRGYNPVISQQPLHHQQQQSSSSSNNSNNIISTPTTPSSVNIYPLHSHSQSPVLSTHELYKTAGWLDHHADPIPLQSLLSPTPRRTAVVNSSNQNYASNVPNQHSLFDSSDESGVDDIDTKKHKKIATMVKSSFDMSSVAPIYKPISELKNSALITPQQIPQPQQQSSKSSSSTSSPASSNTSTSITNTSMSNISKDQPMSDVLGDDDEDDDEDTKSVKSNDEEIEAQLSDSGSEEEIPKSMEEIYQLSNLNRRRNKEKKKLKETPSNTSSDNLSLPSSLSSSTNQLTESGSKKKGDLLDADPITFMKGIGWIPDGGLPMESIQIPQPLPLQQPIQPVQPIQQQQQPQSHHHQQHHHQPIQSNQQPIRNISQNKSNTIINSNNKKSSNNSSSNTTQSKQPFVPFDYSQQQTAALPQSNYFNIDFQGGAKQHLKPKKAPGMRSGVKSTSIQPGQLKK